MMNSGMRVAFRVDGGGTVGMGHVMRCLALARILRDEHGCDVSFRMHEDPVGISHVRKSGWPIAQVERDDLGAAGDCDAIIIDLPAGVSADEMKALRRRNERALIILMHGMCSGRLQADMIIGPMERLSDAASWVGFRGQRYEGPAYAILDSAYAELPKRTTIVPEVPRLLVTMGGSDPYGLTLQALHALDAMRDEDHFECAVALGPAFMHERELQAWLAGAHRSYEIKRQNSLRDLMMESDLAIVSYGTTVYELAATGLPSIALSITEDHAQSAEIFARGGSLISLGLYSEVSPERLQSCIRELLRDATRRAAMARAGQLLVDGKGAERVAGLLVAAMEERRAVATRAGA
jgi:spore coat polysaccharide biosynthesis predicted glycosyltransferase SpsG